MNPEISDVPKQLFASPGHSEQAYKCFSGRLCKCQRWWGVLFLDSSKSHVMALPVLDNHLHVNQTRACSDCGWNREWDICMVCLLLQLPASVHGAKLPASVHGAVFAECVWFTVKSSHSRAETSTDLDPSQNTWNAPLCSYAHSFLHSTRWHRQHSREEINCSRVTLKACAYLAHKHV